MSDFEPTDWKNTSIPKLAQLDSLQRCLICKDFLKAPVMTSCNHTFCSLCIRQHLMNVSRCPLCKAEQFESNLKRVILLEELVLCFQALRDDLISLVQRKDIPATDNREIEKNTHTKLLEENASKTNDVDAQDSKDILSSNTTIKNTLSPGYVHCPVCKEVMREEHVQGSHLDYCLNGKPDPKLVLKTHTMKRKTNDVLLFFQGPKRQKKTEFIDHAEFYFEKGEQHHHSSKRIPKVDFASLSTVKVKEKLAALKLPTLGSRAELEWRYNQYYLLHQSNLDSNHPLSDLELRQKLKQTEISQLVTPSLQASNTIYGDSLSRKSLSDKDFPIKIWLHLYNHEFRRLIKQARRSRKGKSQPTGVNGSEIPVPIVDFPEHENTLGLHSADADQMDKDGNTQDLPIKSDPADSFDLSHSTLFAPK